MDIMSELEAAIAGDLDTAGDPQVGAYADHDQATQWMEHKRSALRQKQEITGAFQAAVARMKTVVDARVAGLDQDVAWIDEALGVFHAAQIRIDPKHSLTITLPNGVLKSGVWGGAEVWEYEDTDAFEAWCIENLPGAVSYPAPEVSKAEAKKLIKESLTRISDGVIVCQQGGEDVPVPGIVVSERPRAFKAVPS